MRLENRQETDDRGTSKVAIPLSWTTDHPYRPRQTTPVVHDRLTLLENPQIEPKEGFAQAKRLCRAVR
jgi:hypothetical protein